jgi:hypothetical protein
MGNNLYLPRSMHLCPAQQDNPDLSNGSLERSKGASSLLNSLLETEADVTIQRFRLRSENTYSR